MINIKTNVLIHRPVQQVFEFISNPENDFLWQYGTLASTRLAGTESGQGAFFTSISHFMGQRNQSTFEVIEYELNNLYAFKSLSGPLQSFTSYIFNSAKGSTQVDLSIQANVVNLVQLSEALLEKKLTKQLKENFALLKSILETG